MPDGSIDATQSPNNVLDRLSPRILGGVSAEQKAAIAAAAGQWNTGTHRVNLRVSLPMLPRRWYFTILGDPERRTAARHQAERTRNPVRTGGNFAFILLAAIMFYGAAAAIFLFSSSVLE